MLTNNWWMKLRCKPEDQETGKSEPLGVNQHSKAGRTTTGPRNTIMPAPLWWLLYSGAMSHTNPEASVKGFRQLCKHSLPFVQLF